MKRCTCGWCSELEPDDWRCELCESKETQFHNDWTVEISGIGGSDVDNRIGEERDLLIHEISLCDACARIDGDELIGKLLRFALKVQQASERADKLVGDLGEDLARRTLEGDGST